MTLGEFLAPVRKSGQRDKILVTLYYAAHYQDTAQLPVAEVSRLLRGARLPGAAKISVSSVLAQSQHFVHAGQHPDGRNRWGLTDSGAKRVEELLGIKTSVSVAKHDAGTLKALLPRIADVQSRLFCQEAVICLEAGALRAAVVFTWTGAVGILRAKAWAAGVPAVNRAALKFDPKARTIAKLEDFAYVKDSQLLLILQQLGQLDKGERATLEEALNLRNRCSHPTKYIPGEKKVSSFLEDLLGIVFF
jgi:hypothetical protein